MATRPYVLVPPSLGKATGGRGRLRLGGGSFRRLGSARRQVVAALEDAIEDPAGAARVFAARGDLLDRYLDAFVALREGRAPSLPAWARYTGVVWDHLDPGALPDECLRRLLVPSALMGLTTGADPVPDHRLGFAVSLPELGRLDRWWRDQVTAALVATAGSSPVIDLLPNEHAAAIDFDVVASCTEVVHVRFLAAGGRRAAGHAAKAVKGIAANTVLTGGIDALAELRWECWRARWVGDDVEVVLT